MPIFISPTWEQNENTVIIAVNTSFPVAGKKAHALISPTYVKLNSPPYFFEVDLYDEIDDSQSWVHNKNKDTIFTLRKKQKKRWTSLSIQGYLPVEEIRKRRSNSIQYFFSVIKKDYEQKQQKLWEREQLAQKEQWELETKLKDRIDDSKADDLTQAEIALHEMQEATYEKFETANKEFRVSKYACDSPKKVVLNFTNTKTTEGPARGKSTCVSPSYDAVDRSISQRENLTETRHTYWRKKGEYFLHIKDIKSAISAYTMSINRNPDPRCFSNRGLCYFLRGNLQACIDDCKHAVQLLVSRNLSHRIKAISYLRIAVAALYLGNFDTSVKKLEEVSKIYCGALNKVDTTNILQDKQNISTLSLVALSKFNADSLVREHTKNRAISKMHPTGVRTREKIKEAYTQCLRISENNYMFSRISAAVLSSRGLLLLKEKKRDYGEKDFEAAFRLLCDTQRTNENQSSMCAVGPVHIISGECAQKTFTNLLKKLKFRRARSVFYKTRKISKPRNHDKSTPM